ncbi:hypothetical protein [Nocardiopsis oceani]
MKLGVGQALTSAVDQTAVIVVRALDTDVSVTCGGVAMVDAKEAGAVASAEAHPEHLGGTQLGKRYVNEADSIELLCTKPGEASLAVEGTPLSVKDTKPLPASD